VPGERRLAEAGVAEDAVAPLREPVPLSPGAGVVPPDLAVGLEEVPEQRVPAAHGRRVRDAGDDAVPVLFQVREPRRRVLTREARRGVQGQRHVPERVAVDPVLRRPAQHAPRDAVLQAGVELRPEVEAALVQLDRAAEVADLLRLRGLAEERERLLLAEVRGELREHA